MDDDMALYETWHVGLLDRVLGQIGSSPEPRRLLAAMDEARRLSARAADIYAEHPLFSEELMEIQKRQSSLAEEIGPIADAAGAPSCATLVVLP